VQPAIDEEQRTKGDANWCGAWWQIWWVSEWASASVGGWHKSHALLKCVRVFLYNGAGFPQTKQGLCAVCVSHTVALPFTLQFSILRAKRKELWQILSK
jgi:hypothetical protein